MLEEMLKENDLIGDIGEHAAFKQLHRQIALFNVGDIVSGVDNAEELIHQYQSTNLSMPKADEKIQAIIKSLEALKSALPRYIKESYTNFSKLEKSDKEAAYHCAKEFLSYTVIGEKYAVTPLWRQRKKVKQAANFIADYEGEMKRKQKRLDAYKQKESERLRQEREKLNQYIAQTEAEMHVERQNYQHQVALLKQRTELASIELEQAKNDPSNKDGGVFCLPVYIRRIGVPQNDDLKQLRRILKISNPWVDRIKDFNRHLSTMSPLTDINDVEYIQQLQYGLQKGMKSGSLAEEVKIFDSDGIAEKTMQRLDDYISK